MLSLSELNKSIHSEDQEKSVFDTRNELLTYVLCSLVEAPSLLSLAETLYL